MKLWLKISVACIITLLVIVVSCSTLLLLQTRKSMLELTVNHAKQKQSSLENSFTSMAEYYMADGIGEAAQYSMIMYCFSRFADETGVLIRGNETLISQAGIRPQEILPLGDEWAVRDKQKMYSGQIQGGNILIIGSNTYIKSQTYAVYIVQDITPVYNEITSMMWWFALISFSGILIGTALIVFLVRRASKPLGRLGMTTKQIAEGDYSKRAQIHTHDEVGSLAQDFNHMADAVENHIAELTETAKRQRLFIGGVTHEFKTPLTTMLIHSDTLLNTKMSEKEKKISLTHIHEQCEWLERMTQKMLKLITLNEDIILRDESVNELFGAVYESIKETLEKRGTPLVIECKIDRLPMDFDLMRSLCINLVDNASKASALGQSVLLRAYDNVIEVKDSGTGIAKKDIARLTEPFYMADSSRSKTKGGSGLGLAIVRQIADAHNAQLVIKSVEGKGTTVKVIFPIINR